MFSLWFLTVTASMTVETSYWGGVPSSLGITLGKPLLTSVWKWVYSCICIMPAPEMYKYTVIKNSVFSVILPWLFFRFDIFIHKEFNVWISKFVTGEEYMVWFISYSISIDFCVCAFIFTTVYDSSKSILNTLCIKITQSAM